MILFTSACANLWPEASGPTSPTKDQHASNHSPPLFEHRRALFAQATTGLIFEKDRVRVDPALARPFNDAATARVDMAIAETLLRQGRRIEAVSAFARAVIAAPGNTASYLGLARALAAKGRAREARAAVLTALSREPSSREPSMLEARFLLGSLSERLGDRSAAIEAYERLLELAPAHGRAYARLAALNYLIGSVRTARKHLMAARDVGAAVPARLPGLLEGRGTPVVTIRPIGRGSGPSVGPEARIDTGAGTAQSNEITAAATATAPGEVVAAWNDFREDVRLGAGVTLDGGATWTDFIVRPPLANQSELEGDPMSAADPRTGTLWVGGLSFLSNGGIFVARKNPGAATFEPSVMVYSGSGADKPWMAAGRPPATSEATHLYVTYNQGLRTSVDLGDTWSSLVALEPGIGYLPRVGPLGELYVANADYESVRLQISLDGGATIGSPIVAATRMEPYDPIQTTQIPGIFRAPAFNYLAVDPVSGRLTFVWFDTTAVSGDETDVDLYFSHSIDGVTWTAPSALLLPGDQFLPWLEADAFGRLHMVFLDTRNTAQSDSDAVAWIDAYYAYSEDGGASWSEIRLTASPWSSALAGPFDQGFGEQFIGDYLGLAVSGDQVFPVYLSTQNGDADLFTRVITFSSLIFEDGFESGDLSRWQ